MRSAATIILASGALFASASVQAATPSDAASNASQASQTHWLADARTGCRAIDSDFDAADTITWTGSCAAGNATGPGTLTVSNRDQVVESMSGLFVGGVLQNGYVKSVWADGSSYDGEQVNGKFEGSGVFTSAAKDRLDGQWKDGRLEGRALVIWANGDRYDGEWHNGVPDGHGTQIWANGRRFEGVWHNGQADASATAAAQPGAAASLPQDRTISPAIPAMAVPPPPLTASVVPAHMTMPTAPALPPSSPPVSPQASAAASEPAPVMSAAPSGSGQAANAAPRTAPFEDIVGKDLLAVDGSKLALDAADDGISREIVRPDGASQKTLFIFMSDRLGTVADAADTAQSIGVFRLNANAIDIDYTDGHAETLRPNDSGGISITTRGTDGNATCMSWFPPDHTFTTEDRKAALANYARELGVPAPRAKLSPSGCAATESASASAASAAKDSQKHGRHPPRPMPRPTQASYSPNEHGVRLQDATWRSKDAIAPQTVTVRPSTVHLIDAPAVAEPPGLENAPLTEGSMATVAANVPVSPPADSPSVLAASSCLGVEMEGGRFGFRNHCQFPVQFSYCVMSDANPLTSCRQGSVTGSVASGSFGALTADLSLNAKDAGHDFRWIGCGGGAGEVIPHLDRTDPPGGRCVHARLSQK